MSRSYTLAGLTLAALIVVAIVAFGILSDSSKTTSDDAPASDASPLPPGHPPLDQGGTPGDGDGGATPAGDTSKSIAALEKQLARDPADTKTGMALGAAYLSADQPEKALKLYDDIVGREPGNRAARVQLALALHATGDDARAVAILRDVIEREPGDQAAHYNLAIVYFSQEKPAQARQEWRTAAAIDPASRLGLSAQNFIDLMEGRTPAPTSAP